MTTVLVSGAIGNKWFSGGSIWTRLSYLLGLRKLGYQVFFVEQIAPETCVDENGKATTFHQSINLSRFRQVIEQFGLSEVAALICGDGQEIFGMTSRELIHIADQTDVLINISGHLKFRPMLDRIRCKVFIDQDPGFTQFWHAAQYPGARLSGYDYYYTVGENIGTDKCEIPTGGIRWRPTRQPVVLDYWTAISPKSLDRFTTVGSWRGSYGRVDFEGRTYGLKVHEFRKFLQLPQRSRHKFEIALDIHPDDANDLNSLREHGWNIIDPKKVAGDPDAFRRYIQSSGAEFSVAQGIYVETASGWFSDRTVRYLACGRPALVQDTGFRQIYPVGRGLLTFQTLDEAVEGAKMIAEDYVGHCQAAREIAERFFDSDEVLGQMMDEIGFEA